MASKGEIDFDVSQTQGIYHIAGICESRMVKISIRANSQIKTALLTVTAANPTPSRSTQRAQPQRPVSTTQAPCPQPHGARTVPAGVWDFLSRRDIGCPSAGSETTVCSLLHRKDHAMSTLTTGLAGLKLTASQKPTQISPAQQRCNKLLAGFQK